MRSFKVLLIVVAGLFILSGCAQLGIGGGSDRSGTLVVYTPNSEGLISAVVPAFEEQYGISVELIQAGTGELFARLRSESDAPIADVVWGGAYSIYAQNLDLFEPYVSPNNQYVVEAFRNSNGYTQPYVLDGSVLVVNRTLTAGMNIRGYMDLLNPDLFGRIATADPRSSSSAFAHLTNMLLAMGGYESEAAWQFVDDLFTNIDGNINPSSSGVFRSVADGEMMVGLSFEDPIIQLIADGADVDVVYMMEGTVFLGAEAAIIRGAGNIEYAQRFIDFIISHEIQEVFGTTTTNRPVRADVQMGDNMIPITQIHTIIEDYEFVMANREAIVERFDNIHVDILSR
ncbi:MAG: extracellular solute-binding protein [Defluviitaleaceae bacterium]|nr:extracellular solute-binding protein [Defluviitaleaceae bacterium]